MAGGNGDGLGGPSYDESLIRQIQSGAGLLA